MMIYRAFRVGELVRISDISIDESGAACGCVCVECGGELVARFSRIAGRDNGTRWVDSNGISQSGHFSHKSLSDCSGGAMTALHLTAQKIIRESKAVFVPPVKALGSSGRVISLDSVEGAERQIKVQDRYRLIDVIGEKSGRRLGIEITVTHACDEQKIQDLEAIGIPTIEVDLRDFDRDFDDKDLADCLVNANGDNGHRFKWIFHKEEVRRISFEASEKAEHQRQLVETSAKKADNEREVKLKREAWQKNNPEAYRKQLVSRVESWSKGWKSKQVKDFANGRMSDKEPIRSLKIDKARELLPKVSKFEAWKLAEPEKAQAWIDKKSADKELDNKQRLENEAKELAAMSVNRDSFHWEGNQAKREANEEANRQWELKQNKQS